MSEKAIGTCLCSAVTLEVVFDDKRIGVCHCGMCRQWASGPYMSVACGTNVSTSDSDHIKTYSSSDWAERAFCKTCGSALYARMKETNQHYVAVGLFLNNKDFNFTHQIFIDNKPDYYDFANDTQNMTEAEILAMISNS